MAMRTHEAICMLCLAAISTGLFAATGTAGSRCPEIGKGYRLGVATSLEKVSRDARLSDKMEWVARLDAAGNEYEHFQILLRATKDDLQDVVLEADQLVCYDHGKVIKAENISFHLVDFVRTKKPAYEVDHVGWYPDPLLPFESFDVIPGSVQPVWVSVYVPASTPAGHYSGSIRIQPEQAPSCTVGVEITVRGFDLPDETNLKLVFSLYENNIRDYYRLNEVSQDLLRAYYSFLLAYRINPTNLYLRKGPQPHYDNVDYCVRRGMNAMNVAYLYDWEGNDGDKGRFSEEYRRDLEASLARTVQFLRERQWESLAFVYGPDEPNRNHYPSIRELFSQVKRWAPNVRRVLTHEPTKELYGYVDVWVPRIDRYDQRRCRERQAAGEEIWWYVCATPHHPYPNFFIDYPAIDHRIIFWLAWKYDISGFLYYSLNRWVKNYPRNGRRWPDVPWNTQTWGTHNGDGQLIYPGRGGGPYSSVRFEVIRDGIEDYEYLRLLGDAMEKLSDRKIPGHREILRPAEELVGSMNEDLIGDITHFSRDGKRLLRYREKIAEQIERLERYLDEHPGS